MLKVITEKPLIVKKIDVPIPKIKDDELLVKIYRIGICGSDIHAFFGNHPYAIYPMVQNHEVSGIIDEVGEKTMGFSKGDLVTINPQIACGECYTCTHGDYHICENLKCMGFQAEGFASEYCAVKQGSVYKLPNSIGFNRGAMIEPLAVAVHAISKIPDIKDKNILVLGAGPIGNLVAQCAKADGAGKVLISDLNEYRLSIAKKCNIDEVVNSGKEDISKHINSIFGTSKADVIFECVGSNTTINTAVENARRGSRIVVCGVFGQKVIIDMAFVQKRELKIEGTLMYKREDFIKAIEYANSDKINLDILISKIFPLKEYAEAYKYIDENRSSGMVMKVLYSVRDN